MVGVSGGPDSVCLTHILARYFGPAKAERLVAVHVNHMLRGDEALRDEKFTADFCASIGIELISVREDVQSHAAKRKISLEAAGREARYGAFERERGRLEAATGRTWRIAVAHSKDDCAETVLMNILRGTGTGGLRGMAFSSMHVVRPLLRVDRASIAAYLAHNKLAFVFDGTNADVQFTRNRLRAELLPLLRNRYNPKVGDALCKLSESAGCDDDYLSLEAERAYDVCFVNETGETSRIVLSLDRLNALHPAIAIRVIRLACAAAGADVRSLGYAHMTDALQLAAAGRTGAELQLPGGLRLRRSYGVITFEFADGSERPERPDHSERPDLSDCPDRSTRPAPTSQKCPDRLDRSDRRAPQGFVIKSLHKKDNEIVEQIKNIRYNSSEQFFDADVLRSDELVLRYRRSGDFFFPIKSPGVKKLKDFFIDIKIPGESRNSVALLAVGPDVVWVIGYRVGERYKVTDGTQNVLRVRYFPNGADGADCVE